MNEEKKDKRTPSPFAHKCPYCSPVYPGQVVNGGYIVACIHCSAGKKYPELYKAKKIEGPERMKKLI